MSEMCLAYDLSQVTEYKDDSIHKTQEIGRIWVPMGVTVPRQISDVILCPSMDQPERREVFVADPLQTGMSGGFEALANEIARCLMAA